MSAPTYLTVDLDVATPGDLEPLVTALERRLFSLLREPRDGRNVASFELPLQSDAEDALLGLCAAVEALDPPARAIWDAATTRALSIGIDSGTDAPTLSLALSPTTLARIASLGADLEIVVYPLTPRTGRSGGDR